jgi:periplasmic protein TonB
MYLFNNQENRLRKRHLPVTGGTAISVAGRIFEFFTGEENPRFFGGSLLILVLLLHLWGSLWLLQPAEPITLAQPLMMEMSLVSAPSQQASIAPPASPKTLEPIKPRVQPKKTPVKKPVKKKMPVHKQNKPPKPVAIAEETLPEPSLTESFENTAKKSSEVAKTANAAKSASEMKSRTEPYTEANFNANYGANPKPKYPSIARSRGWQGKVLLRVKVTSDGLSEAVAVHQSSGHEVLDESAIAAVENWKFIPAKRGNTPVACTVIVPIIFALNN